MYVYIGATDEATFMIPSPSSSQTDDMFEFGDKSKVIEINKSQLEPHLSRQFTIMTWMKHNANDQDTSLHGVKERILCHTDADGEQIAIDVLSILVHFILVC